MDRIARDHLTSAFKLADRNLARVNFDASIIGADTGKFEVRGRAIRR